MDLSVLVVLVLLVTVGLRLVFVMAVVWLVFPRRDHCPKCEDATIPLLAPRVLRALRLERRWCLACGWSGMSKRRKAGTRAPRTATPQEVGGEDRWRSRWDDDDQWSPVGGDEWK